MTNYISDDEPSNETDEERDKIKVGQALQKLTVDKKKVEEEKKSWMMKTKDIKNNLKNILF